MARRVMVIGLDCAPPALVFDRLRPSLPNLSRLMARGIHRPLRSVVPPITVPAWACMVSGRDPGELGLYGFRGRVAGSYDLAIPEPRRLAHPRVWDLLSEADKRVAVLYVPMTTPAYAVNGVMLSGFVGDASPFCYPAERAAEWEARFGPYAPDVDEFRTSDPEDLVDRLYDTTAQHFALARAVWNEESPDFLMMVEMGTDRVQHALYKHLDPQDPSHDPADPLVRTARDYYAFVDAQVGSLLREADADTSVLVVSDHGARTMEGAVAINELLRREGWLTLREELDGPTRFDASMVDWSRTRAFSTGGYYARIFLNVEGREPAGVVPADQVDARLTELTALLSAALTPLRVDAHRPRELYREVGGLSPDLLVFFGDLSHRAIGTVGGELLSSQDDRGADGANHDWEGIFIGAGPGFEPGMAADPCFSIHDVGPTALSLLSVPTPADWLGQDRSGR